MENCCVGKKPLNFATYLISLISRGPEFAKFNPPKIDDTTFKLNNTHKYFDFAK